jgi:predicted nucleic acid-binding protein
MILLDTDVLIDCLRGLPSADTWLRESPDLVFAVPGIAAMELIVGCRDKADLQHTQAFIRHFDVVWPEAPEIKKAFGLLLAHRLQFGVSIPDCIIAAMALERSVPLYTFNLKHYRMFPGLEVHEPYNRSHNLEKPVRGQ